MHNRLVGRMLLAALMLAVGMVIGLATATQASTNTTGNPWTYQMTNPLADGMEIVGVQNSSSNLESWFDYAGAPIAAMGQEGGFKVFGDNVSVNPPGNIFQSSVVLHDTGGVTLAVNGPTLYGGSGPPNMACQTGDFYFRQSTTMGRRIYECNAGRWIGIL